MSEQTSENSTSDNKRFPKVLKLESRGSILLVTAQNCLEIHGYGIRNPSTYNPNMDIMSRKFK